MQKGGQANLSRIRESLAFASGLLQREGVGVAALDTDLRYMFWSSLLEKMSGRAAAEVIGKSAIAVFPDLIELGEDVYLQRALAGEDFTASGHRRFDERENRDLYYEAHYSPLTDEQGAIVGVVVVVRDTTQRTLAEHRLRETESRFKNMADATPVLLWMAGTDSLCTFFNQSWLSFTGRTLEQERGAGWAAGVHREDIQRTMDAYLTAFNARRVFEIEFRLRRADGEYRWVLDRGTPRYLPNGRFAGYIGSCIDITDRKRAERELRKAVSARDDFVSIAAHEFRTPLTTLQLEIESMNRALERRTEAAMANAKLAKNATAARKQTARLITLVEELLDVSRVSNGNCSLQKSKFDLGRLVAEVAERMRPSLDAARCPLELDIGDPNPGFWDRPRIEQVVSNILSNAMKYGAGAAIRVRVARENEHARVEVCDHGIGIPKEAQTRIFGRFERAHSSDNYGGFGLGLWISREILVSHGGSIEVESDVGRGSKFTVKLPLSSD